MSEDARVTPDIVGKLTRFTPGPSGIDRDELLFRAGRASGPTPRWWKWAAVALLVTQTATLAALIRPPADRPPESPPAAPTAPEPPDPIPLPPGSYGDLSGSVRGSEIPLPAPATDGPHTDAPPLSVASAYRGMTLD